MANNDIAVNYAKLKGSESKSILKRQLTEEIFQKYKDKKTSLGGTLLQCIQSGCQNLDSGCGLYACDPEAYDVFQELFDNVIKDYHKFPMDKPVCHPKFDFGPIDDLPFGDLDPSGKIINSTRVRFGRSIKGCPCAPLVTDEQRKECEGKMITAFKSLDGEMAGDYISLPSMTKEQEQKLIDDHFLFKNDDRFLETAGGFRNWPHNRGIFFNKNKTFLSWVNEEDHCRFISMQKGGHLGEVYSRLIRAMKQFEKTGVTFAYNDRLGFVTFCPTNLGTTCRASVHAKIPKLLANKAKLDEICDKFSLQARGTAGEHTENVGGVADVSNKRRLGLTEIQAVTEMAAGVKEIIAAESSL